MANHNHNLQIAKREKFDEFYTSYKDIENEVETYYNYNNDVFRGKVVMLPCDDYRWSNFFKYFKDNFERFGLAKLIATCYNRNSEKYRNTNLFDCLDDEYKEPTNEDLLGRYCIIDATGERSGYLSGSGDFRSEEITRLRDESDFIITNPPFSLWREFFDWVQPTRRKFLLLGTAIMISYSNVMPVFMSGNMSIGNSLRSGDIEFEVPGDTEFRVTRYREDESTGQKFISFASLRWWTNIEYNRVVEPLELNTYQENMKMYKSKYVDLYEEFDTSEKIIEVCRTNLIPIDYEGLMAVPLTFLDKYDPERFDVVGIIGMNSSVDEFNFGDSVLKSGKDKFKRLVIRHKSN